MIRFSRILLSAILLCAGAAFAADDDGVMGNYRGDFTGAWARSHAIEAQVAGLSDKEFKAVLLVREGDGAPARLEITGKRKGVGIEDGKTIFGPVTFAGEVDLLGTSKQVGGTLKDRVFEGTLGDAAFTLEWTDVVPPTRGQKPPAGAVVLVDGTTLDAWKRTPEQWCMQSDGSMQVCSSSLMTKQTFGDAKYHIEFKTPYMPNARGQARGNSGVYIMGRYEVQVVDSFGWETAWDLCSGIYKVSVPKANAVLPPLSWQTYDIDFTAPRYDADGNKTANAMITVVHNGVTVHENLVLEDVTPGGISGQEVAEGPLMLQDHHDPVSYRNIWVVPSNKQ